jgi:hypothetical protein
MCRITKSETLTKANPSLNNSFSPSFLPPVTHSHSPSCCCSSSNNVSHHQTLNPSTGEPISLNDIGSNTHKHDSSQLRVAM